MFNINFQDKKIVVSLAIDQPTTGYGDYLMLFLPDTVKIYDVVINPATNWAGFTESDLYVDTDYPGVELFLNGLQALKGQKVSLDPIGRPLATRS